jgi:hypothetical protein
MYGQQRGLYYFWVCFTTCKWSVQFRCCALWNRPTVEGDFWCTLMPGKALHWRHHQNWVSAQLLLLISPYFSNARHLGLTTSHEPLFWYPGPRALPYTSWVKLGEGPCASNKWIKKRGERKDPRKQLVLYFWGRNEVTNQGGEVTY